MGFKCNMTDVAAAMGLAQLDKAEQMHTRRTAVAEAITRPLKIARRWRLPPSGLTWPILGIYINCA